MLAGAGFAPDIVAGHSLGELAALHVAGFFDRRTLAELVVRRGQAMGQQGGSAGAGGVQPATAMVALLGAGAADVRVPAGSGDVWVANKNAPDQVVLAGAKAAVDAFVKTVKGLKAVPLEVSNAFHTKIMGPAADAFAHTLREYRPRIVESIIAQNNNNKSSKSSAAPLPVVFSNVTAKAYPSASSNAEAAADAVVDTLAKHITSPVEFVEQVRNMHAAGVRIFVEFGPRRALAKFAEGIILANNNKQSGGAGAGAGGDEVVSIAINPSGPKGDDSETQLRDAVVQLAVCGVPLPRGFDPWALRDAHSLGQGYDPASPPDAAALAAEAKLAKTTLRLKASTCVCCVDRPVMGLALAALFAMIC